MISLSNVTELQQNGTFDSYSLRLTDTDRTLVDDANYTYANYTYDLKVPTLQHTRIPYLFIGIADEQSTILCKDEHVNVTSWTLRRPAEPIIDKEKSTSTEIFLRMVLKFIISVESVRSFKNLFQSNRW